jgi:hypothetical protein
MELRHRSRTDRVIESQALRAKWDWDVTVIVAELPPGMNIPNLKLTLTSEDGRAAILEARDLP